MPKYAYTLFDILSEGFNKTEYNTNMIRQNLFL